MVDLTTTYLGLKLKNPIVASAAQPISEKLETAKRLEEAGIAALVMYSLFEEQSFTKAWNWIIIFPLARISHGK